MIDPRIASLAGAAESAAATWSPFHGPAVDVTEDGLAQLSIMVAGPIEASKTGYTAIAYLTIEEIDELLRDLLAVRADLVKHRPQGDI